MVVAEALIAVMGGAGEARGLGRCVGLAEGPFMSMVSVMSLSPYAELLTIPLAPPSPPNPPIPTPISPPLLAGALVFFLPSFGCIFSG